MDEQYTRQVALLLRIIPELNKIPEFAMHGGSAINLFHHDMPRLSVDIDLTYIPFDTREKDLQNIDSLLKKLFDRSGMTPEIPKKIPYSIFPFPFLYLIHDPEKFCK
ncbi:MAG: nucleotidyl transferase AbiEii/AbiGii toxin family protein [Bacteroidales bacterium]|nr:nucleotidyl transferase AbiEii/AbiGii toxin family protein [Bacteroidales bacterium]MCF8343798.1 nucleotidyl transferase AbiEii/AbiGii toxin family protein [Bacteroidales bacterium]MCF8376747.1 nucleotidyl transferase AbiEii/AbiGii toxin family protein [Bacteroidales bacterium]